MNCPTCATPMKPLAGLTEFCPNDCDRATFDNAPTAVFERRCECGSANIEPFETSTDGTKHCWDCGRVFK